MAEPYAPPHADTDAPPQAPTRQHSRLAFVMGVLSVIFASLHLLSDLADLALPADPFSGIHVSGVDFSKILGDAETRDAVRMYQSYVSFRVLAMSILSIALLAIGIGLIRQKGKARGQGVIWGGVGLAVLGVRVILWQTQVVPLLKPVLQQAIRAQADPKLDQMNFVSIFSQAAVSGEYLAIAILAVYAIVLMILLSQSSVKEKLG